MNMKKTLLFAAMLVLAVPAGARAETYVPDPGEFEAAIIMQPKSRNVLYAYNPEKPHVAASLTKLLTALTTLELHPSWDKIVSIESADEVGGGRLRVDVGAKMTVRDLLYSSITASANNTAMALSRVSGVSRPEFVERMNQIAVRIGAKNTRVFEASGMDVRNMTTAYDIARITEAAFAHEIMTSAATIGSYRFALKNTNEVKVISSTNGPFLTDNHVWLTGGKTGYLHESKYNLTAKLQPYANGVHDPKHEVIVVVLGAPTKDKSFESVKKLAAWAWDHPELFVTPVEPEKLLTKQLTYGMSSEEVKTMQSWLALDKEVYPEGVTSGFFGPLTLRAVQKFQIKYKVVGSAGERGYGVVGPATRGKLFEFYMDHHLELKANEAEQAEEKRAAETSARGIQNVLVYGHRNEEVRLLQTWLSTDKSIYPEGVASGFFGQLTLAAVRRFQMKHGIVSTPGETGYGVVGPATRAKLHALFL
jgi:D-alanyl-D-alanine carboxypeptidase